jgi:hypothetical protein
MDATPGTWKKNSGKLEAAVESVGYAHFLKIVLHI